MLDKLRSILAAPVFKDEEINRLSSLFNIVLIVTLSTAAFASLGFLLLAPEQSNQVAVVIVVLPLILFILYLMRRGHVRLTIKIYTVSLWFILALLTIIFGGIHTPAFTSFIIVILMAGMLWSEQAGLFFTFLTIGFGFSIVLADILNIMVPPLLPTTPFATWTGQTANFFLIAFFLYKTRQSLNKALTKARDEVGTRKKAEAALRQGEMQLRHVLDTVPEGVLLLDENGRINLANAVADKQLALLAPDRGEGLLRALGDKTLEVLLSDPPEGLWHQITAGKTYFEAIARPVQNSAQKSGWVLVVRDVTQEREIQRQSRRNERLEVVEQLASGVAHDFNNIIAVIMLHAQMLAYKSQSGPYVKEKLGIIQQQGKRAVALIQQILDFSRQSVLNQQPLEVVSFLEEMVEILGRTIQKKVEIQLNYRDGIYMIYVDPARIEQVITNLAANAQDAMPGGGRLTISLERMEVYGKSETPIAGMKPGSWIIIHVSDTGHGMSPETISRIFEPFFSTKELGRGTGLGLAQVYGIMKQHSGHLEVHSEVDKGTTFSLYFPAFVSEPDEAISREPVELPLGAGETILLVEDNLITREVLVESLEILNYKVIEAGNGREALERLTNQAVKVDIVISDVVMPEMSGIDLLRTLRKRNQSVPMIILTGHPMTKELDSLHFEGLNGWLLKPPTLESLANMIEKVLKE